MQWLDRLSMMGVVLLLAGCSDDGLTPPLNTSGAETGLQTSGMTADSATTAADTGGEDASDTNNGTSDPGTTSTSTESGPGTGDESTGEATGATTGGDLMCIDADDCVLVDDCCTCSAAHMDDIPECGVQCEVTMCEMLGLIEPEVVCEDELCGLAPLNCDDSVVSCDGIPPECPMGTLPEITELGDCWTGACVPIEACDGVPSCEFCDEQTEACVQVQTQMGTNTYCEPLPDDCGGVPSCACLPEDVCPRPYDTCIDGADAVQCTCLEC